MLGPYEPYKNLIDLLDEFKVLLLIFLGGSFSGSSSGSSRLAVPHHPLWPGPGGEAWIDHNAYWISQKRELHSITGTDTISGCNGLVYFFINDS